MSTIQNCKALLENIINGETETLQEGAGQLTVPQVQSFVDVIYAIEGLAHPPKIRGFKVGKKRSMFILSKDLDENMFLITEIKNGEISPMPVDSFSDYSKAKQALAKL